MLSWTVAKSGGPKRADHAAVAVRNKLYSFGGCDGGTFNNIEQMDVHVFNTVSLCWKKVPPVKPGRGDGHLGFPSRRYGHTAVLVEDTVYIWGGWPYCNVLYAFDVDTHRWFKPSTVSGPPGERYNHSACVLEKVMFIHGGGTMLTGWTNDMYKLDTSTMVWSLINTRGTPPPASWCHATIIGTKMFVFVFGGLWGQYYNTIRVFDTETDLWLSTPSPQPLPEGRSLHSEFTYNEELYIFGGWNGNQAFNDLWKFSPKTFSWKKVEPKGKGPGSMYGMCCCMVGDRIILFGGSKGDFTTSDELYILDLSPSLKTLCKLAVTQHGLDQSELPHDIRWELVANCQQGH